MPLLLFLLLVWHVLSRILVIYSYTNSYHPHLPYLPLDTASQLGFSLALTGLGFALLLIVANFPIAFSRHHKVTSPVRLSAWIGIVTAVLSAIHDFGFGIDIGFYGGFWFDQYLSADKSEGMRLSLRIAIALLVVSSLITLGIVGLVVRSLRMTFPPTVR